MKLRIITLSFILSSAFNLASSQDQNIDQKPITSSLDFGLNGIIYDGNVNRVLLINTLGYVLNNEKRNFQVLSFDSYVYGTVGSFKTENDFRSANYLILNANKKFNPVFSFFYEKIKLKGIDALVKPAVGIQYQLVTNKNLIMRPQLMVGYAWQNYAGSNFTDFDNNGEESINGANANLALYTVYNTFGGRLNFILFGIYQMGIEESKQRRLWFDLKAQIPVWKVLFVRLSLNNYFENIALEGRQKNDFSFNYGIGVKLKFAKENNNISDNKPMTEQEKILKEPAEKKEVSMGEKRMALDSNISKNNPKKVYTIENIRNEDLILFYENKNDLLNEQNQLKIDKSLSVLL